MTSPPSYDAVASCDTSTSGTHDHSHSHQSSENTDHDHSHQHKDTLADHHEKDGAHDHAHAHNHHGSSSSSGSDNNHVMKRLKTATALCVTFFLVEVTGGYLAGSLAVLSDAAHLLADLASFAVAIAASHLSSLPTTDQHTFGLKRVESLAALFSMMALALVSVGLAVEAIRRLVVPPDEPVDGPLMSGIATIGVLVNVTLAFVLGEHHVHMPGSGGGHDHDHSHGHGHDHEENDEKQHHDESDEHTSLSALEHGHSYQQHDVLHSDELPPPPPREETALSSSKAAIKKSKRAPRNINLHAAYLHVLGDLAQSVAVLIAGLVIWAQPTWTIVDPICTLLFCALVFYSTLGVLRSSISVLLEEVPPNLSWRQLHDAIEDVYGVEGVHDLHIWSISHSIPTLSVHCFANDPQQALEDVYCVCKQYGVVHATIQVQKYQQGHAGTIAQPPPTAQDCITCAGEGKTCHSLETSKRNGSMY